MKLYTITYQQQWEIQYPGEPECPNQPDRVHVSCPADHATCRKQASNMRRAARFFNVQIVPTTQETRP